MITHFLYGKRKVIVQTERETKYTVNMQYFKLSSHLKDSEASKSGLYDWYKWHEETVTLTSITKKNIKGTTITSPTITSTTTH